MFYVYVLHSLEDRGLYIGFSTDLRRRMAEHKQRASFATKHRGPWKLIYYEAYIDRQNAEGRERYLKSGSGRRFLRQQLRRYFRKFPVRQASNRSGGYPAWIRTKNNASKGRCVTVTPRGIQTCDFRFAIFDSSAMSKIHIGLLPRSNLLAKSKLNYQW
jgi:putative endonuclease